MKRSRDPDDPPAFPVLPSWAGDPALDDKPKVVAQPERPVTRPEAPPAPRPAKWGGGAPPPSPWESKPDSSWRPSRQPRDEERGGYDQDSLADSEEDQAWSREAARKSSRAQSSSRSGLRPRSYRRPGQFKPLIVFGVVGATALAFWLLIPNEAWEALSSGARQLWDRTSNAVVEQIESWRGERRAAPVAVTRPEALGKKAGAPDVKPQPARRPRTVNLVTVPAGANVIGPRGLVGVTPLAYPVRAGVTQTVTFTLDGYLPVSHKVGGGRMKTAEITIELVPKGPEPVAVKPAGAPPAAKPTAAPPATKPGGAPPAAKPIAAPTAPVEKPWDLSR